MDHQDLDWSYWMQQGYSKHGAQQMALRKYYVDSNLGYGKSRSQLEKDARDQYPIPEQEPVKFLPNYDNQQNRDDKRKGRANALARRHAQEIKRNRQMKFSNPYVIDIMSESPH